MTKRQFQCFFCFPSGLMDMDTPPYTPRTRASTRRSAGPRLLHFQMMMSALKVCDGWRWFSVEYSPPRPVNTSRLSQQRDVHASVFSIQNQKDENKDGWHVAMPTSLNLLMAVPWAATHERCWMVKMETDICPTCRNPKRTDKPFCWLFHPFPSFMKRRWS